jgi:5-(carboxyamino)imidazole ribonucleotide mutase
MTWIPVFGVPVNATCLNGMDSLLSIAQMPGGIPVCTMSIGNSGAKNAGLAAGALISVFDEEVRARLIEFRDSQSEKVVESVE